MPASLDGECGGTDTKICAFGGISQKLSADNDEFTDRSLETAVLWMNTKEVNTARHILSVSRNQIPADRPVSVRAVVIELLHEVTREGEDPHC